MKFGLMLVFLFGGTLVSAPHEILETKMLGEDSRLLVEGILLQSKDVLKLTSRAQKISRVRKTILKSSDKKRFSDRTVFTIYAGDFTGQGVVRPFTETVEVSLYNYQDWNIADEQSVWGSTDIWFPSPTTPEPLP